MKNVLMTNYYSENALSLVRTYVPNRFELIFLKEQTNAALKAAVIDADYIIAGGRLSITKEILDGANRVKMIQRSGVGLDTLDLNAIKEKKIPLYVNRGVNAQSVAEHTLLLMLACLRRLTTICKNTKNGIWEKQEQGVMTAELKGKTVGIIGMGKTARTLVQLLRPFQVRILYYSRTQSEPSFEKENCMEFVRLDYLLNNSDIVSLHCSLSTETNNLINSHTIGLMKDGAILINTARGQVINTIAVADALRSGKLSYAGLDVHSVEPIPDDYPLMNLDNVILTPHIAGVTADSFRAMMRDAFRNIELFDQGRFEEIEPYRYL